MDKIKLVRYIDGGKEKAKYIIREGRVIIQFGNKSKFEGTVAPENSKVKMVGKITYAKSLRTNSKHSYEGELIDGKKQGEGKYTIPPGNVYSGTWENDVLMNGELTEASGRIFKGSFTATIEGEPLQNEGKATLADGTTFEGVFIDDKRDGQGILTTPLGIKYQGEFKMGYLSSAFVSFPTGDSFNGTFSKDGKFLQGCYTFQENGSKYDGYFTDNSRHGEGKFYYHDGSIFEGTWEYGMKRSGRFIYPDGKIFEGSYKDVHGKACKDEGVLISPSGARYEGKFKNGLMHGKGKFIYPNGDIYEGEWKNGAKHGKGKYFHANGDQYSGTWENDLRDGTGKHVRNYIVHFEDGELLSGQDVPFLDNRGEELESPNVLEITTAD